MHKIIINGGKRLNGEVTISGAKNSAVALSYLNFAEEVLKHEREEQTKHSRVQARWFF